MTLRRRVALRLLPFVFLLYFINYIDRVNVSFAALRMKADLGLSDSVYGFGASLFFLTYVLFEIPGAVIVERWSARKWIARIMVSWGLVTVFTAFIHTAGQFYAARLLLGAAEASFYPGVIVFLTHWFTLKDRGKAVGIFYAAIPVGTFIGAVLAGWLLNVHWMGMPGWRWLFVVEGIPAILLGGLTLFYLPDHPSQAGWLSEVERNSISAELAAERIAKIGNRRTTFWDACRDLRLLLLLIGYFFYQMAVTSNSFWLPTFLQRLSGLPATTVARLIMLPAIAGLLGLLFNSWHSDRSGERKWHAAVPIFCAACCYALIAPASSHLILVVLLFTFFNGLSVAAVPSIWAIPTMLLSDTIAAAFFGFITSFAQIGAFIGPSFVGRLNDKTHSLRFSLVFIASSLFCSALCFSSLRLRTATGKTGHPAKSPT
jgi:MFS transporter, ACS family, tartrate transporter